MNQTGVYEKKNAMDESIEIVCVIAGAPEEYQAIQKCLLDARWVLSDEKNIYTNTKSCTGIILVNGEREPSELLHQVKPSMVISTGHCSALFPRAFIGDIIVASHAVQHKFDLTNIQGESTIGMESDVKYQDARQSNTLIALDSMLRRLAFNAFDLAKKSGGGDKQPTCYSGIAASGRQFVHDTATKIAIHRLYGAICADRYAATLALACKNFRIPCLLIRTVSDTVDGLTPISFQRFAQPASEMTAKLLLEAIDLMCKTSNTVEEFEFKWKTNNQKDVESLKAEMLKWLDEEGYDFGPWSSHKITDFYFDDQHRVLGDNEITFRVRREDEDCWLMYKLPKHRSGSQFARLETKVPIHPNIGIGLNEDKISLAGEFLELSIEKKDITRLSNAANISNEQLAKMTVSLRIENDRNSLLFRLRDGLTDARLFVDEFTPSRQGVVCPSPLVEIELEIEGIGITDLQRELIRELAENLQNAFQLAPSENSKYRLGMLSVLGSDGDVN